MSDLFIEIGKLFPDTARDNIERTERISRVCKEEVE